MIRNQKLISSSYLFYFFAKLERIFGTVGSSNNRNKYVSKKFRKIYLFIFNLFIVDKFIST